MNLGFLFEKTIRNTRDEGFTLIEVLIVTAVIVTLISGTMMLFVQNNRTAKEYGDALRGQLPIYTAMERITQDLQFAKAVTTTGGTVTITDLDGVATDYSLTGADLSRSGHVLADGMATFSITAVDSGKGYLVSMSGGKKPHSTDALSLKTTVYPKNVQAVIPPTVMTGTIVNSIIFDCAIFVTGPSNGKGMFKGSGGTWNNVQGKLGINSANNADVDLSGGYSVNGDILIGPGGDPAKVVQTPKSEDRKKYVTGSITALDEKRVYPDPVLPAFPEGLPVKPNITLAWNNQPTISEDSCFDTLSLVSNYTLTIDCKNSIRKLRVKNLDMAQGHIRIINPGKLELYVDNNWNMGGSSTANSGGDPGNLVIFYNGTNAIGQGAGNAAIYGSVCASTANVNIGGSSGIIGNIITGGTTVRVDGGTLSTVRVVYAPKADVTMGGSGTLKGSLVCKSFIGSGGSKVIFTGVSVADLPIAL